MLSLEYERILLFFGAVLSGAKIETYKGPFSCPHYTIFGFCPKLKDCILSEPVKRVHLNERPTEQTRDIIFRVPLKNRLCEYLPEK